MNTDYLVNDEKFKFITENLCRKLDENFNFISDILKNEAKDDIIPEDGKIYGQLVNKSYVLTSKLERKLSAKKTYNKPLCLTNAVILTMHETIDNSVPEFIKSWLNFCQKNK